MYECMIPQTVYCWGSILERKGLATLTGRAPELCGWAPWLGSVAGPCPPLVLLLSTLWLGSVAGPCSPLGRGPELYQLCGWALWLWALSSSCPPLGRAPELCQLCGWALCPGLVVLLCSLSSSCPPLGRAPELCQLCVLLLPSSWPRP